MFVVGADCNFQTTFVNRGKLEFINKEELFSSLIEMRLTLRVKTPKRRAHFVDSSDAFITCRSLQGSLRQQCVVSHH